VLTPADFGSAATTGEAAARGTLASERFDLVLLDLGLPPGGPASLQGGGAVDGLSVLRELRELRARQDNTPVNVLTGRDAAGDRVKGLDRGPTTASSSLSKPRS